MNPVEFDDIQGLVRFGYGKMAESRYFLLRVRDADSAREWLTKAPVATARSQSPPPRTALQVAFTAAGLRALGVPGPAVEGFSAEFLAGLSSEQSRSRRLGDTGENAPEKWTWGGSGYSLDVLVILFAVHGEMEPWERQVCTAPWSEAFEVRETLSTSDLDGREPFGFIDGISQPELDWERKREVSKDQIDYTNRVALGEFLLGYPNEYGKYTDRPILEPSFPGASLLGTAENDSSKRDLGLNGSYLVLRQLEQDVRGFWKFVAKAAGSPDAGVRLAEAMVGRKLDDGAPLVKPASKPIDGIHSDPGEPDNNFTFDGDPSATRCPFGAHIRRANPRNPDVPGRPMGLISRVLAALAFGPKSIRDDVIASTRFHRILRRGREYGPGLTPQQAFAGEGIAEAPRGIHFACLNANISRQFEFVQNAWIMSGKFNGLPDEPDPLLGGPDSQFSIPREEKCPVRITGIPQFITVRGGGYFFLPGLRALRYIARATTAP